MFLVDTHCHLFLEEFDTDRNECVQRSLNAGIQKILLPNIDSTTIDRLYKTEQEYPSVCLAMMGLHPTSVKENYKDELKIVENELNKRKFIGIGEIGLDLYWDKTFINEQKIVFKTQLEWAVIYNYPVSIHCREAFDEIFEVLDSMDTLPKGVFHCFTGTIEQAQKILSYGSFKLGIGGVLTFKKSTLPEVLQNVELNHIVLETDAPYLAPAPYRGKRNEPSYLSIILEKLSVIKNISKENLIAQLYQNTIEIFNFN
ncbi:MAG: TatD family hydrolase [Bacteroidia bacterium]|nr:MAG: TatD family hydrolase [Bacteroidia bacterium]